MGQDGKLGIDLFLGGTRLRAKKLLKVINFFAILDRI